MSRLVFNIRVFIFLLFINLFVPPLFGEDDWIDDFIILQFMNCNEVVEMSRSNGLSFEALKKQDLRQVRVEAGLRKKNASEQNVDLSLFEYTIIGQDYSSYTIKAINLVGGRGYVYDPRWTCVRLIFSSDHKRKLMAPWIRSYYNQNLNVLEERLLFLALPYSNGITHPTKTSEDKAMVMRTIAQYLGDFLDIEDMREFVYDVAFNHKDVTTRMLCISSILSVFESLPVEVRKELKGRVERQKAKIQTSPETERELKYLTYLHKKLIVDKPILVVPEDN